MTATHVHTKQWKTKIAIPRTTEMHKYATCAPPHPKNHKNGTKERKILFELRFDSVGIHLGTAERGERYRQDRVGTERMGFEKLI